MSSFSFLTHRFDHLAGRGDRPFSSFRLHHRDNSRRFGCLPCSILHLRAGDCDGTFIALSFAAPTGRARLGVLGSRVPLSTPHRSACSGATTRPCRVARPLIREDHDCCRNSSAIHWSPLPTLRPADCADHRIEEVGPDVSGMRLRVDRIEHLWIICRLGFATRDRPQEGAVTSLRSE